MTLRVKISMEPWHLVMVCLLIQSLTTNFYPETSLRFNISGPFKIPSNRSSSTRVADDLATSSHRLTVGRSGKSRYPTDADQDLRPLRSPRLRLKALILQGYLKAKVLETHSLTI